MKTIRLSQKEFDELPEYSCSIPTGVVIGKRWKCDLNFGRDTKEKRWIVREYVAHENRDLAKIVSFWPEIMNETEVFVRDRLYQ